MPTEDYENRKLRFVPINNQNCFCKLYKINNKNHIDTKHVLVLKFVTQPKFYLN